MHPVTKRRPLTWLLTTLIFSMLLVACGGGETTTDPTDSEPTEPAATSAPDGEESESEAPKEEVSITWGGSQATSSVTAYLTAQARLASECDGAMDINVRTTNSSGENFGLMSDGAIDIGLSAWGSYRSAVHGEGEQFDGDPQEHLRLLMVYWSAADFWVIRSDAGVETVEDLEGKPFAAGFQGSGTNTQTKQALEELGVQPDYFEGDLEDITNAMKDGRIVGYVKGGAGLTADAQMLDVASAVDVKLLGFTEEQAEVVEGAGIPVKFGTVPADVLSGSESVLTPTSISVLFVDDTMDDDVAYRLAECIWETIEQASAETNYPATAGHTYDETIELMDEVEVHAGALEFYRDEGAL